MYLWNKSPTDIADRKGKARHLEPYVKLRNGKVLPNNLFKKEIREAKEITRWRQESNEDDRI